MFSHGQWIERSSPQPGSSYFVYFTEDSIGYKGSIGNVQKTVNGGWDWSPENTMYSAFKKAVFVDSLLGFAIGDMTAYQTLNGGQNWQVITDSFLTTTYFNLEERNGTVVLNGEGNGQFYWYVYNNVDGWTLRHTSNSESPEISYVLDENHFYGVNKNVSAHFSTSDGGLTWTVETQTPATDIEAVGLYFSSVDTGFIAYTHWGSTSSLTRTFTGIDGFINPAYEDSEINVDFVNFINGFGNVVCAGGGDGLFRCTPDLGEHWFDQPVTVVPGYLKSLQAAHFWSDSSIVIVGFSGRVLLTDSGIHHSLQTESHFNTEHIAVFPNPSTGMLTIETPPTSESVWTMTLTNSAGQTLMEQSLEQSQQTIDASHLPKGVYFMRLQSEQGVVTKRVVLN